VVRDAPADGTVIPPCFCLDGTAMILAVNWPPTDIQLPLTDLVVAAVARRCNSWVYTMIRILTALPILNDFGPEGE
jgi:hypothetical protein